MRPDEPPPLQVVGALAWKPTGELLDALVELAEQAEERAEQDAQTSDNDVSVN